MLCSGGGLGCTLIRRDVVEAIPFRHGGRAHCDTYFNDDVWYAGYTEQWTNFQMWCGHKAPDGEILRPKLDLPSPA